MASCPSSASKVRGSGRAASGMAVLPLLLLLPLLPLLLLPLLPLLPLLSLLPLLMLLPLLLLLLLLPLLLRLRLPTSAPRPRGPSRLEPPELSLSPSLPCIASGAGSKRRGGLLNQTRCTSRCRGSLLADGRQIADF